MAGRALQGTSAAIVRVVGLALISDTMGASNAGAAIGWQSIGVLVGLFLGPSLGGVVFDFWGHFAVFWMAFGLLVFDILLRFVLIEKKVANKWLGSTDAAIYGTMAHGTSIENGPTRLHEQDNVIGDVVQKKTTTTGSMKATNALSSGLPAAFFLFRNTRILMALWANLVCALLLTAFESVTATFLKSARVLLTLK